MSATVMLTTIVLTFVSLLNFFSTVQAELCHSGLECDYHEYCCGDGCCSTDSNYGYSYGYGFYNLWYFWFVIIMIMMTCCGACSYVKRRQYYTRQQQMMDANGVRSPHPPTTYGVYPNTGSMAPPVGTFPGPPAYNEVTGKPDQFPKANFGYPNYGFAAPPYAPPNPTQASTPGATPMQMPATEGSAQTSYPPTSAAVYPPAAVATSPYPPATSPDAVPTNAPPPYTPTPTSPVTDVHPPSDQSNENV